MENKYYTPEISEFYIGFEYEVKYSDGWIKEVLSSDISDHHAFDELFSTLSNYDIRVKHLDEEDILSLEFRKHIEENTYLFESIPKYAQWYLTAYEDKISIRFYHPDDSQGELWFYGYIKNKNELKKLLQWMDIIPQQ